MTEIVEVKDFIPAYTDAVQKLLEQLTNPAFNRRKVGKYADWQRFGIDIVKEMRRRAGAKYPIMYRIDLSLALNETYGDDEAFERLNTLVAALDDLYIDTHHIAFAQVGAGHAIGMFGS